MNYSKLPLESIRVDSWLKTNGFNASIIYFKKSAKTAQEAADALGCDLGQIAKSLVFYQVVSQKPILIIASGKNRVDKDLIGKLLGTKIKTAGPDYVLNITGFSPGGVPPVGHPNDIKTIMDQELLKYDSVWAAAGHPHTLFSINPQLLASLSQAEVVPIY